MPALDQITIKGYKSIKDATVELRSLNVLIGANGAGKSNFINFFRLISDSLSDRYGRYVNTKQGGANDIFHYGVKNTEYINFVIKTQRLKYEAKIDSDDFGNLYLIDEKVFDVREGVEDTKWDQARYWQIDREQLEDTWLPPSKKIIQAANDWQIFHFHDTTRTAAVKQPSALNDNAALRADAGNLAAFLYLLQERYRGHYDQIVSLVRRVVPRFDTFALRPDPLNPDFIQLEWREMGSDFPFRAQHLSDGSLRFICLATLLMQPNPPSTVIIDEPELGLHPVAIELLAEMLRLASARTQVIVATQSPGLVNAFSPEDIITVDRVDGATTFQRHTSDSLAAWLGDYSLGELWEKNVIGGRP